MKNVRLPMVCVHNEAGRAQADANRELVLDAFRTGSEEISASGELGPFEWLGYLVAWLNLEHGANIESILTDMWSAVTVDAGYPEVTRISVQCDRVEDGLFAICRYLIETP